MTIPISLLVAHWVGDFLLQTDKMAVGKSKHLGWLTLHVLVYSLTITMWGLYIVWSRLFLDPKRFTEVLGSLFSLTFVTHFLTDAITSKITSKLWFFERRYYGADMPIDPSDDWYYVEGKRHWFFVMIGLDQLIHFVTLAYTLKLLS